jgi:3-dehydroquinate synthase
MLASMRKVRVVLGERSYEIQVGRGLLARLGNACQRLGLGKRCVVITDTNVAARHAPAALGSLRTAGFEPALVTVPAGERSKSLSEVGRCYGVLASHRLERQSFGVALGGGVVGDLAGFVTATYLRGIALVQVPTTLLAQVDSSVGGKTGVNLPAGKNLVGAFWQPRLVLCDLDTLMTLPDREYRSGLAEVIKYGIIRDARLFRRLERTLPALLRRDLRQLGGVVARCCAIKADVVAEDETESGVRAILNFGHTIGHGLEAITGYGRYLHGEAIAIGQVLAARLSEAQLGLSRGETERIEQLLAAAGLPVRASLSRRRRERLMAAMSLDKKVLGGELRFVLAERIGRVRYGERVPAAQLERVLEGGHARAPLPVTPPRSGRGVLRDGLG